MRCLAGFELICSNFLSVYMPQLHITCNINFNFQHMVHDLIFWVSFSSWSFRDRFLRSTFLYSLFALSIFYFDTFCFFSCSSQLLCLSKLWSLLRMHNTFLHRLDSQIVTILCVGQEWRIKRNMYIYGQGGYILINKLTRWLGKPNLGSYSLYS